MANPEVNAQNIERLAEALKMYQKKTDDLDGTLKDILLSIATIADKQAKLEQKLIILGVQQNFDSGPTVVE